MRAWRGCGRADNGAARNDARPSRAMRAAMETRPKVRARSWRISRRISAGSFAWTGWRHSGTKARASRKAGVYSVLWQREEGRWVRRTASRCLPSGSRWTGGLPAGVLRDGTALRAIWPDKKEAQSVYNSCISTAWGAVLALGAGLDLPWITALAFSGWPMPVRPIWLWLNCHGVQDTIWADRALGLLGRAARSERCWPDPRLLPLLRQGERIAAGRAGLLRQVDVLPSVAWFSR